MRTCLFECSAIEILKFLIILFLKMCFVVLYLWKTKYMHECELTILLETSCEESIWPDISGSTEFTYLGMTNKIYNMYL